VSEERNLTEADADAVAAALEARLVKRFYLNLGMGVWGLVWKSLLIVIVGLAAYGTVKSHLS
jgi:hypothetical protein